MIYNLSNSAPGQPSLWQVSEKEYTVHEYREFTDLICGGHPTLIHNNYLSVFAQVSEDQLEIKPVKIIRKSTNETWENYSLLIITNHISQKNIDTLEPSGLKIWDHHCHPFVSAELKLKLEELPFNKLSFSEGFSMWA